MYRAYQSRIARWQVRIEKTLMMAVLMDAGGFVWLGNESPVQAEPYELTWHMISGGGITSSGGGVYSLSGSVVPQQTDPVSGDRYTLNGGFWPVALRTSPSTEFDGDAGPWSAADSARIDLSARPGWLRLTTPPGTFGTISVLGGLPVDVYPPPWHLEMSLVRPANVPTAIGILTQSDGIQFLFNNFPGRTGPGGATSFGAGALWNASGKGLFGKPDFNGVPESAMAGDAIEIWAGVINNTTMRYGVRPAGSPDWNFAPEVVGGFELSAAPVSFASVKIMVENRQPWFDQWPGTKASLENVVVDIDYIRFIEETPRPKFRRGDVDPNDALDTSDAIDILYYKFLGQFDPTCLEALDADDSGEIDQTDAIRILNYAFLGGGPLPEPFMTCGADTTPDKEGRGTPPDLGCESYPACVQ
ncbi:MAG: hypothetical protein HY717_01545 [Planctomycetes bacterium]|nr:hypothetical protein [Planctomycetota bacterium]